MVAKEALKLFEKCNFNKELNRDTYMKDILSYLPKDFNYEHKHGVSKFCIIPENEKFVIKIPFRYGIAEWDDDYYQFSGGSSWIKGDPCWDYCLSETFFYKEATRNKISKIFCKERLLGIINNYPIYIQEKVDIVSAENDDKYSRKEIKTFLHFINNYDREYCDFISSEVWIYDAIKYYGERYFNKVIDFIDSMNICDLHNENTGYIGNRPVIFDYSSFEC